LCAISLKVDAWVHYIRDRGGCEVVEFDDDELMMTMMMMMRLVIKAHNDRRFK